MLTSTRRHTVAAISSLTMVAASVLIAQAPASAATPVCPSEYYCAWINGDYASSRVYFGGDANNYQSVQFDGTSVVVNDRISSVANRAVRCNVVMFDAFNRTGPAYVTLSYPAAGGQIQDPNLTNGIGAVTANFDNRLSSHDFCR